MPGATAGSDASPFSEREFYRREFRGRTLAIAIPRPGPEDEAALAPPLRELASARARAVLLSPDRELLVRLLAGGRPLEDGARLPAELWRRLHRAPAAGVVGDALDFGRACRHLARRLGVFKLVWIDPGGGLRDASGARLSFVHLDELGGLIRGGGEGLATTDRMDLWREVGAMLAEGVPAVNVCSAAGLYDELFRYAGSGTLFTRERYMHVRDLGLDDYDAAADLLARGEAEGYLAPREPAARDRVLACGFGAFVEGHHLAGIGALLPGADGRSGEIASLYTLTRFLGEGVGVSLVRYARERARAAGFAYVYACTTSPEVGAFFERNGLRAVGTDAVPPERWHGYDPGRRQRVRCYRLEL